MIRSIDLGAMGFVPKRASNETLHEALHVVMSGGIYVPPMTMSGDGRSRPGRRAPRPGVPSKMRRRATRRRRCAAFKLTPRQTDVLALLLRGLSNKLIARELNLSVETVKDHVAAVLRALGVNSRTQAVLAVSQMSGQGGIAPWPPRPSALSAPPDRTAATGRPASVAGRRRSTPSRCCATRSAAPSPSMHVAGRPRWSAPC